MVFIEGSMEGINETSREKEDTALLFTPLFWETGPK